MSGGPRMHRHERVVASRDGRRIAIVQEGVSLRMVRRLSCPDPADRTERLEAFDLIVKAAPQGFNPVIRATSDGDRLEIFEEFSDGFSLGGALDVIRQHISVNVALAIAFDVVRGLSRLHAIKRRNGDRAHLIHGRIDLDNILVSTLGETLVTGLEGSRGDQKQDVESVMVVVQELLASRAMSPQGRALMDRLGQLQFTAAPQLESAIKLYLDRQDPKELLGKRARFCSQVIAELGGAINFGEELTPAMMDDHGEDSTVYEPIPAHLRDTRETKAARSLGEADPWGDDSGQPSPGSNSDSWKNLQPSWAAELGSFPESSLDPWKQDPHLANPEDPTTLDAEAIEIAESDDDPMSENEATDAGSAAGSAVRAGLMGRAVPPLDAPKKSHVMVGDYKVVASIGRGGMGEIYLARRMDRGGELVALKVLGLQESGDDAALDMFMDEAAILAQVDHPNVLKVVDFGKAHGRYFLATEYLEGRPLVRVMIEAYSKEQGLDYGTVACVGADAAYGLYAAHTTRTTDGRPLEIVHRDVSPQNIFVTYLGTAKVIDFGVARAAERMSRTAVGLVKGKAAYMSPEQAEGRDVDARSDVFSLGTCLWEMTAGKRLFKRDKDYDTLLAVQLADIDPPTKVRGIPDPDFDRIILAALERDRDKRTSSARQLATQLTEYASAKGIRERNGRMINLMQRLFGEAAEKESELIRSLEARSATEDEAEKLRQLSGVTGRGQRSGLEELDDFGSDLLLPGPVAHPTQAVLAQLERLKVERTQKPISSGEAPQLEVLEPLTDESLEVSSSAGIQVLESDFESVVSDRGTRGLDGDITSPKQSGPIPDVTDTGDRVPTTLLGERRRRTRRALVAMMLLAVGGGALFGHFYWEPKRSEKKPSLVGGRVDLEPGSKAATKPPVEKAPPPPPAVVAKTSTASFEQLLEALKMNGVEVRTSEGTHLVQDVSGDTVILDHEATISRVEVGDIRGYIVESGAELKTSVTWVGTSGGEPWAVRPLSVNDCPAGARIHATGIGLRYGGPEILLPHGGGKLRDVSLNAPPRAKRMELEPLGLSFGKEDRTRPNLHCKIGWWGKRVVLRRLPLGRYSLKWSGEGVSQDATLDVAVDKVTGGDWVRSSSVSR